MTNNERLTEAVRRTEEAISYGAKMRGLALPDDFAIERARNIVSALVDLFEDAADQGRAEGERTGAPVGALIDDSLEELNKQPMKEDYDEPR